jgi:thioredoxin reductase
MDQISGLPKVAIIGAGPNGILTARHCKNIADVTVFESKDDVGGMWIYTETTEQNHTDLSSDAYYQQYKCLHSSMYKHLISNLPKYLMTFKDFPHPEDAEWLLPQEKVHKYCKDYAAHFDLYGLIKFGTTVTSVKPPTCERSKFTVEFTSNKITPESTTESLQFDYVIVWVGHSSLPNMPYFPGDDLFKGNRFHMHSLREFESNDFDDKTVLIVGAWFSGFDMLEHLFVRKETKDRITPLKVIICGRNTAGIRDSKTYKHLQDTGILVVKSWNLRELQENSATFEDGSEDTVDTIIYCSGYVNCFPFFNPQDKIIEFDTGTDRGGYYGPLHKKMFCINNPNVVMLGSLERNFTNFTTFERQAMIAKQYIEGNLKLPSKEEMLAELQKELDKNEAVG